MTYTFTATTFNSKTNRYQTGLKRNGEIIANYLNKQPQESALQARVAAMIKAIDSMEGICENDKHQSYYTDTERNITACCACHKEKDISHIF